MTNVEFFRNRFEATNNQFVVEDFLADVDEALEDADFRDWAVDHDDPEVSEVSHPHWGFWFDHAGHGLLSSDGEFFRVDDPAALQLVAELLSTMHDSAVEAAAAR